MWYTLNTGVVHLKHQGCGTPQTPVWFTLNTPRGVVHLKHRCGFTLNANDAAGHREVTLRLARGGHLEGGFRSRTGKKKIVQLIPGPRYCSAGEKNGLHCCAHTHHLSRAASFTTQLCQTHTHTYVHTYIHTHIHTYMHTNKTKNPTGWLS